MERAEGSGWVHRVGALFSIGPSQKRFIHELNNANTGAIELVLTPLILAGIGLLIGRAVGGATALAFVFGFVGLAGCVYRLILDYKARMAQAEEGKPWTR